MKAKKIVVNKTNYKKSFIVGRNERVEMETLSVFDKPKQQGEVEIKAVVLAGGSLNLKGVIKIGKGIEGVEAFLRQRVLLVGPGARAVAIPELEIESNEVKASHAASVGRIDEEQLFYLQSRGVTREEAVELVIKAFLTS
jgi:Fe-S cluster assembly scaffold protein SufB